MYETLLLIHSWLRWVVVLAGLAALVLSAKKALSGDAFTTSDKRLGTVFTVAMDIQLVIGLGLYFGLSPVVRAALDQGAAMMRDRTLRFWGVEHMTTMILALVVLHVGRVIAKRAGTDAARHKRLAITTALTLVLVFAGIPWPGLEHGRPLLRLP